MLTLTHLAGFGGRRQGASVSYRTQSSDVTELTTYTFAGLDIGTAGVNRHVVVGVISHVSGTPTVNSVTIGGQSATALVQITDTNERIGLWIAAVPSGATGDVVVTHSAGITRCGVVVWAVYGLQSATATATASDNASPLSQSLTINSGGVGIGFASGYATSAQTWTWTDLTENVDVSFSSGANHENMTGASREGAGTFTVTATKTGTDTNDSLVLAALR